MMQDRKKTQSVGAVLLAGRQQAGLSIRQLAEQSGVPRSTILRLEQDVPGAPNAATLLRLAQCLELSTTEVFRLAGIPLPDDRPTIPAMLRADYDLPPEAIAEVQQSIERIARKYRRAADKHERDQREEEP